MSHPLSKILLGQANALALPLPGNCIHVVVTSPPYWALRYYGVGVDAGELGSELIPDCWRWTGVDLGGRPGREPIAGCCHVCNLRLVLRELWRVLHPSGSVWFNYGQMFAQDAPRGRYGDQGDLSTGDHGELGPKRDMATLKKLGIKKGDQVLMLERLALAFQLDGWYIRTKVIWHKTNPMPGPAGTWRRPVDSYETVLLLAKDWRYYYDAEAVREKPAGYDRKGGTAPYTADTPGINHGRGSKSLHQMAPNGRHLRDVWSIPTKGYKGAHFACYPPDLVRPCILAGTSAAGVCPACGWPWERIVDGHAVEGQGFRARRNCSQYNNGQNQGDVGTGQTAKGRLKVYETVGWAPSCDCPEHDPVPALVLDPFTGSGTTNQVARELGRLSIGLDISHDYLIDEAYGRLGVTAWREFYTGKAATEPLALEELPLFAPQQEELTPS